MPGLLLGCGLRYSEVVGLRLDQLQLRESHRPEIQPRLGLFVGGHQTA